MAAATGEVDEEPTIVSEDSKTTVKFGSAENTLIEEVSADIAQCDRANGSEELFESQEQRIRRRLSAAYKAFRRATADPAYCAILAKKLLDESGGTYRPSEKKPWNLAARLALRPTLDRHVSQTYEAAYFYRHASIEDISIEAFEAWIEGRNQKKTRDFVRGRSKAQGERKAPTYPNLARARKLKHDAEVTRILKETKELAETELASLFASRDAVAANA